MRDDRAAGCRPGSQGWGGGRGCGAAVWSVVGLQAVGAAVAITSGAPVIAAEAVLSGVLLSVVRLQSDALGAAHGRALAASRAKADFLATMSHEVRTPLHGLTASLDLLAAADLASGARRHLATAQLCVAEACEVVADILEFARIDDDGGPPETVVFAVRDAVEQAIGVVRAVAERKRLTLTIRLADQVPDTVEGDGAVIRRVLVLLIGNAVKFTDVGGVLVEVGRAGDGLRFSVSDTGIGIDPALHDRLFGVFEQVDSSTTRRFGGSGLGLALCARLVHHLGGEIEVRSRPGEGSRFSFTVPLGVPAADRVPVTFAPLAPLVPPPEWPVDDQASGSGPLVLVVEDNALCAVIAREILAELGCRSIWAADGPEALAMVATDPGVTALLLDSHLPGMHGHEVATRVRASVRGDEIRLLGLTADASPANLAAARAAGMDRCLPKPARLPVIRDVLRELGVLPMLFDLAPLIEARAIVRGDSSEAGLGRAVALLEAANMQAVALVDELRGDAARAEVFHRAHGALLGGLLYATELLRHRPVDTRKLRFALDCLDNAIAWEDR